MSPRVLSRDDARVHQETCCADRPTSGRLVEVFLGVEENWMVCRYCRRRSVVQPADALRQILSFQEHHFACDPHLR